MCKDILLLLLLLKQKQKRNKICKLKSSKISHRKMRIQLVCAMDDLSRAETNVSLDTPHLIFSHQQHQQKIKFKTENISIVNLCL